MDDAIPDEVSRAGFPTAADAAAELRCAKTLNPFLGAGTDKTNRVAGFQPTGFLETKAGRANGNIVVGDLPVWIQSASGIVFPHDAKERAAVQTGSQNNRSIFTHALPAQDDAGVGDVQAAANFVFAFQKERSAAKTIRVERQARDIINRLLDTFAAIAGLGFDNDAHRCVGNRAVATGVTAVGKVRHLITAFVRLVSELAVLA